MTLYMLDTNTVSHLIKDNPAVACRVVAAPMASLCISAITEGELMFGLSRRPEATRLQVLVREFLLRVDSLSWDSTVAKQYGEMRAQMEAQGKILAPMDLLIAAHAVNKGAILVTNDHAFRQVHGLQIEDWMS